MVQEPEKNSEESIDPADAVLVDQARAGRYEAYEELVRRYQRRVYALVYNMTGNREDAEDMVQDVFVKAYRSLNGFKGDSSFYTWIYRIAVNRTINHLKRRKWHAADLRLDAMDAAAERDPAYVELRARESPVRDVSLAELQKKLNEALLALSDKHRTAVVLHDIQGMPHEEIARIMKCSVETVRTRLFYARRRLRRELAEYAP